MNRLKHKVRKINKLSCFVWQITEISLLNISVNSIISTHRDLWHTVGLCSLLEYCCYAVGLLRSIRLIKRAVSCSKSLLKNTWHRVLVLIQLIAPDCVFAVTWTLLEYLGKMEIIKNLITKTAELNYNYLWFQDSHYN